MAARVRSEPARRRKWLGMGWGCAESGCAEGGGGVGGGTGGEDSVRKGVEV